MPMAYYRIVRWADFQHYKDRNPPWIKLHREMLSSRTWVSLDDAGRVLAIASMMLAAATGNRIPADPEYVRRVAYLSKSPNFAPLVRCGFVELVQESGEIVKNASTMQADAIAPLADARPEREAETEEEKNTLSSRATLDALSVDHIADWLSKKRAVGKYLMHDEHFVLEQFKDYCRSKGKKYADYIAAYRAAFEWDRCQPRTGKPAHYAADPASTARDIGEGIIARRRALRDQGRSGSPGRANPSALSDLRQPEDLWGQGQHDGVP